MTIVTDVERLLASVEELGGKAPKAVTAALSTAKNIQGVVQGGGSRDAAGEMRAAIKRAGEKGRALSEQDALDLCSDLVESKLISSQLWQEATGLDFVGAGVARDLLRGEAGDLLVGSLSGPVDRAAEGIREAAGHYGPETTAAQVIDLGVEAVTAWKGAEEHEKYLDEVLNRVLRPLAYLEGVLPPEMARDFGHLILAGWFTDRADRLNEVGVLLTKPTTQFSVPGGRWLAIYRLTGGIELKSPREVSETFAKIKAAEQEQEDERQRQAEMRVANFRAGPVRTVRR